jgi:hypothetical protein
MQTQREYLASKGLAIAGSRGRFSREGKAELERARGAGVEFSDSRMVITEVDEWINPDSLPATFPPLREYPVLRDLSVIQGYSPEGHLVSSGLCFKCARHVSRCPCSQGITASPIVDRWTKEHKKYGAPIDSPSQV